MWSALIFSKNSESSINATHRLNLCRAGELSARHNWIKGGEQRKFTRILREEYRRKVFYKRVEGCSVMEVLEACYMR